MQETPLCTPTPTPLSTRAQELGALAFWSTACSPGPGWQSHPQIPFPAHDGHQHSQTTGGGGVGVSPGSQREPEGGGLGVPRLFESCGWEAGQEGPTYAHC